jgi:hypothetical protein
LQLEHLIDQYSGTDLEHLLAQLPWRIRLTYI